MDRIKIWWQIFSYIIIILKPTVEPPYYYYFLHTVTKNKSEKIKESRHDKQNTEIHKTLPTDCYQKQNSRGSTGVSGVHVIKS